MSDSNTDLEKAAYNLGYQRIAGVDEVGRGPLAGPVVVAACIFPKNLVIEGVNDSKKLSPKKREELYFLITNHPEVECAIAKVENERIDLINILQATLEAMSLAIHTLDPLPDFLLIDGNHAPKTDIHCKTVIKGDSLSQSIGAASIIAKYERDTIMKRYHETWPEYGFNVNMGYGTKKHIQALKDIGPCRIHRGSFEPMKSLIVGTTYFPCPSFKLPVLSSIIL